MLDLPPAQARRGSEPSAGQRQVAEGLSDILTVLNSDRTLQSILDYLVSQAQALTASDACVLYRLDREAGMVLIEAQAGLVAAFAPVAGLPLAADGGLQAGMFDGWVLNERPVVCLDTAAVGALQALSDPQLTPATRAWFAGLVAHYRTLLSVPLIVKQTHYGSLGLYYMAPRDLSEGEVALAMTFGSQLALAIENARLRLAAERAAILQERSRVARDLHDSVTQSLYSLTLLAEAARRLAVAGDLPQVQDAITRLGEIGHQALKEMRLMVYELRPLILRREGLVRALNQRLETVERRAGIEAHLVTKGLVSLPPGLEDQLYHLIQEALNNALKHAAATAVQVRIELTDRDLQVEVADNGKGFVPRMVTDGGGLGLISMRERVEELGGELVIASSPGEGTRILVALDAPSTLDAAGAAPKEIKDDG